MLACHVTKVTASNRLAAGLFATVHSLAMSRDRWWFWQLLLLWLQLVPFCCIFCLLSCHA